MIREEKSPDDVTFESGLESQSGFREVFSKLFGQPPAQSHPEECIYIDLIESPLGPLLLGGIQDGLCLLEFTDRIRLEIQLNSLRKRFGRVLVPGSNKHTDQAREQLRQYFAGERTQFDVPLVYPGTEFEVRVWNALLQIPYGEMISYEDLAGKIGSHGAARAAGRANGLNRIAIIIPCHRVVNKSGKLGGYGGGLWRKQFLLNLECKQALIP